MNKSLVDQALDFLFTMPIDGTDAKQVSWYKKMEEQVKCWISNLNVWGTGLKIHNNPRVIENGLELCAKYFIDCGAAARFGDKWK